MHPTAGPTATDSAGGEVASMFSFIGYGSESSSYQVDHGLQVGRRSRHLPTRLFATLQRWTKRPGRSRAAPFRTSIMHYQYQNSPFSLPLANLSTLDGVGASITGNSESLISEVIRNRAQFDFIAQEAQPETNGSETSMSEDLLNVRNVLHSYLSALEMAELQSRAEGCSFRPMLRKMSTEQRSGTAISDSTYSRMPSFRDVNRRMRPVPPLVGVYHVNWPYGQSEEDSRLGFAHIPDQMHRKAVKKGFNFTLMVVGESGLGKSTLINSLFMQELYKDREVVTAGDRITYTTQIEKRQIELDERGVKLRLTVVDTPGFNDAVDCTNCWRPIEEYIDSTFEQYFKDECGLNRKNIHDHRVHCCLYFISPFGHGLRQVDVEFMRRLQHKVNIVPIIAKADALTAAELHTFKDRIMSDLDRYKIDIYRLPECDSDEEDEIKRLDKEIKSVLPFAVIGSNCTVDVDGGRRARGRQYPWGVVEVDNSRHCDFTKLRIFLLKTHMQDLKDMTLDVHYENYRAKYITERMSKRQTDRREGTNLGTVIRTERDGFDAIVDQDSILRQKEEEIHRMQQAVHKMNEQLKRGTGAAANASTTGPQQLNSNRASATGSVSSATASSVTIVNNA